MAVQFADEARIFIKAGNGGKGCVSFIGIRGSFKKRPNGGLGGDGGSVILLGNSNLSTLMDFRYQQHYYAEDGKPGGSSNLYGQCGADLIIQLPLGTVVTAENGESFEIVAENQPIELLHGGKGGRGNFGLRNPHIVVQHQGEVTEGVWYKLELKLMADAGVVGFPNAGKSSLVRKISGAKPKVADYPFTTLQPTLGVVTRADGKTYKIADIPGLIEGAHTGIGLGNRFLKHIERVRCLIQMIDVTPKMDESREQLQERLWNDYKVIEQELSAHDEKLLAHPRIILLNKIDQLDYQYKIKTFSLPAPPGRRLQMVYFNDSRYFREY
jgi:GTP-binding protein